MTETVFGHYNIIDLMLRNIINQLQRIFVVTAVTVGLWFE
jgi:ADP-glucose pyrophosphorylase